MIEGTIDTIVAVATPRGRGGIGVIRVSGNLSGHVAEVLLKTLPMPRKAHYGYFYDRDDQILDQGIALFFQGPNSFTGEDVLELHGHGSPVVLDSLLQVILGLGVRLASPGEFSKRAFLNDKIDLSQAEAIADLIDASSVEAARLAIRSLQGDFSKCITDLVERITHLRMYVEAAIDFSEEEIDFLSDQKVFEQLDGVLATLAGVIRSAKQGAILREGVTVVIAGKPNVGKSSLLNRLSGQDSAIVTDIAGTTRDVIREHILIDQVPFYIFDTAGLQESDDIVEREGVRRTLVEIEKADHILLVVDDTFSKSLIPENLQSLEKEIPLIVIKNKIDLTGESPGISEDDGVPIISVSAKTGEGVDLLRDYLRGRVDQTEQTEGAFLARRRHLDALDRASTFLHSARALLQENQSYELVAEEFRQAQIVLSEITGTFTTDDLLDKIFSSFCIGK